MQRALSPSVEESRMAAVWSRISGQPRSARLALLLVCGLSAGATAQTAGLTDAAVDSSIQRAIQWIVRERNSEGHWERNNATKDLHWAGSTALATLALLYAGQDPREEDLDRTLTWLTGQTMNGTYAVGTRAHALALVPGKKYATHLQADLDWLLAAMATDGDAAGAYNYTPATNGTLARWDHSVSQYGVLGVWMAADAGLTVPDSYWELVGKHWTHFQNVDGGWGYEAGQDSTGSMTAAGLASLFVVLDQRYAERPKDAGGLLPALERGLDWIGREYGPVNPHGGAEWHYYYLYGVERVGRASGYKYFRDKDWFRDGAAYLLREQKPDGSWAGSHSLHNTSWALMFLCHGRAPLLFNKLAHGPDWDNRLRDVAALTRYASHTFERLLNWQIVRLDATLDDLLEAPVLYMHGESDWQFTDVQVQKIREYCQRGGLVFAVAGAKGTEEFKQSFETLARRAFPDDPLRPLGPDHPLFSGAVQFPIADPPPTLEVYNGVRTLMLFCARDLASSWNRYAVKGKSEADFHLGANVYLYATDKTHIRSRLQTPTIAEQPVPAARTISVARIKFDGRWDPEPFGWARLARHMNNEAHTRLLVTSGVRFDSDELRDFSVAHITGTAAFELSPDEARGLRQFLTAGGTLLADAAGGSKEFIAALEAHVQAATREEPRTLPPDSPILKGTGIPDAVDLGGAVYRRAARSAARGQEYPRLLAFQSRRRVMVLYSPLDLTTGLLGTQVYDVQGFEPETALKIMQNMLLYAGLSPTEKARL
jgi:hypothetical protein